MWPLSILVLLVASLAVVQARPQHENVHRPDAECAGCHTAERPQLAADAAAARMNLAADIDARCSACHDDEGPSHHVGILPHKPVPATLPLSSSGLIMCATCHFVHGERDPVGNFVRIDNSRGGLCLTCHELAELQ
jgi:hypothetical protein